MNWGDAPTWVSAIVTAAALIAAYQVYKIESERDKRAEDERRERFQAQRRAQADKIAAWYTTWNPQPRMVTSSDVGGAVIKNSSDLPVYDVTVTFWHLPDYGDKPPSRAFHSRLTRVVPPHDQVMTDEHLFEQEGWNGAVGNAEPFIVSFEFRDAAGIRWQRDIDGKLTELTD